MRTQIAVGDLDQFLQPHEFNLLGGGQCLQRRHDLQPYRLVDDAVGLFHGQTLRSHRPTSISDPPPTNAIHSRKCSRRKKKPPSVAAATTIPA